MKFKGSRTRQMPQNLRHFHICYSTWQGHVEGARFTLYFRLLIKICKQIFISQRFTNHDFASAKAVAIVVQPHVFLNQENNQTKSLVIFLAGARGIEPRSKVLETFILTVVLCPCSSKNYTTKYFIPPLM